MMHLKKVFLFLSLFSFQFVIACDCDSEKELTDLQERSYKYSDLIFLAEVIKYDTAHWSYTLRITETFKGDSNIQTIKGYYFGSCSKMLTGKGRWLVYGRLTEDGKLDVDQCGATRNELNPYVHLRNQAPISKSGSEVDLDRRYREALTVWNTEIEMLRDKKSKIE